MIQKLIRNSLTPLLGACALVALSVPALAGDGTKEAATAATHAGIAAKSSGLQQVHMHLHHAVNCLEGPKGEDYDADQANPCKDLGAGAIPDTQNPETRSTLEAALTAAKLGLASNDLAVAQKQALETEHQLRSLTM